jgi:hypothetical protein
MNIADSLTLSSDTTRCQHRVTPTSRRTAAIALAARALRAAGRKAKLKEYFHG